MAKEKDLIAGFLQASLAAEEARKLATARRRRRIVASLAGGLVVISLLAMTASWLAYVTRQQASDLGVAATRDADQAQQLGVAATRDALRLIDLSTAQAATERERAVAQARELSAHASEVFERDLALSLLLAIEAVKATYEEYGDYTYEAERILYRGLALPPFRGLLRGHTRPVNAASFDRDGMRIATASDDGTARVWSAEGRLLAVLEGHTGPVNAASFNPDGTRVVTASGDGTARLWDVSATLYPGGNVVQLAVLRGHTDWVHSASFSPDGTRIVTASGDGTARLWDADGNRLDVLAGHAGPVGLASFSPDGTRIVTAGDDGTARLWDADSGAELAVLEGHTFEVTHAAWNADGTRIVTTGLDGTARVWDVSAALNTGGSGAELAALKGHMQAVLSASFSPDGTRIVTASDDGTARLWDVSTALNTGGSGAELATLWGHAGPVRAARFSPDGTRIVTAGCDEKMPFELSCVAGAGAARVWDANGILLAVLDGHAAWVNAASFSPDGTRIVTASDDGTAQLWDADGALIAVIDSVRRVHAANFSLNGTWTATAGDGGMVKVWDADGSLLSAFGANREWVRSVSFSPDGMRIVTTGCDELGSAVPSCVAGDDAARVWSLDGNLLAELRGHTEVIYSVSFSPDGTRITTASFDGTARVWDVSTALSTGGSGAELAVLQVHPDGAESASFNADGTRILTVSRFGDTAQLWDADGRLLARFSSRASFSPDGTRVVTAGGDGTVRVWDAADGAGLVVLQGHTGRLKSAGFSPDGTRIVTAGCGEVELNQPSACVAGAGAAWLWDAASGAQLAVLGGHEDWVNAASFNPAGTRIVTAGCDGKDPFTLACIAGTARVWDADGNLLTTLEGHTDTVWSASFSPDGRRVVTASDDGTVQLWEVWSDVDDMLDEAARRAGRTLTDGECQQYLHVARCP